jgi:two-component system, OmpR family, sensor kinase
LTPTYSLAQRLNRSLLLPLALIWVGAAAGSAWHAQAEVGRVLDEALLESAQRLLEITTHELSEHDVPLDEITLSKVSPPLPTGPIVEDDNLMYQVLSNRGHMLIRSSDAPKVEMAVPMTDGFFDMLDWRVYTMKHPVLPVRIHIASPRSYRQQLQISSVLWILLPLLAMLPLIAWLTHWITARGLAPVRELALQIRERTEHDLRPVTLAPLATELAAVGESTNYLMQRLGNALHTERALASNAAHELRTPLATVRLRLQNALSHPLTVAAREEVIFAVDALDQLSRRTDKLLQLSRAEAGAAMAREPVNLAHVAYEVVQQFWADPVALERLQLSIPEDGDATVQGDFDALAIALRNLVENALRYGGNGRVTVSVEAPATLRVTDEGPGVCPKQLALLRHRHVRHSQETSGYGLGISIVTTLMERQRGELILTSPLPGKTHGFQASLRLQPYLAAAEFVEALGYSA